jgi:hypothetical protein
LVVVSIGHYGNRLDWAAAGIAIVPHRWRVWRDGFYDHPAPKADTGMSYGEIRRTAKRILPGAQYRRRLYWRYSLIWTRPS